MSTTINTANAVIKIATGDAAKKFVPYRENFVTTLPANKVMEFKVDTAGQVLYYLEQATDGLTVANIADFDAAVSSGFKFELPAIMTITNIAAKERGFIPYKENFQVNVPAGDIYQIEAKTIGQILYYLSQATDDLTVAYAKKEN